MLSRFALHDRVALYPSQLCVSADTPCPDPKRRLQLKRQERQTLNHEPHPPVQVRWFLCPNTSSKTSQGLGSLGKQAMFSLRITSTRLPGRSHSTSFILILKQEKPWVPSRLLVRAKKSNSKLCHSVHACLIVASQILSCAKKSVLARC